MNITKEVLLLAVQRVVPAIETKGVVEEMGHLVFSGPYLLAYNDKLAINYPIGEEGFNLNCGVVAADFIAAIKGIRTKSLSIEETANGLTIKGGKFEVTLPYFDQQRIVDLHDSLKLEEVEKKLTPLPPTFTDALRACKSSASDNMDNPKGLYTVAISDGVIFSGTGYEVTRYYVEKTGHGLVFIQKSFIDSIINFEPISAHYTKTWAFFGNDDGGILAARIANVEKVYPKNLDALFPDEEVTEGFKFTEDISEELTSLAFFSQGTDKNEKTILIQISPDGHTFLSSTSERGEVSVETSCTGFTGEEMEFQVNPISLKEILLNDGFFIIQEATLCLRTEFSDHLVAKNKG